MDKFFQYSGIVAWALLIFLLLCYAHYRVMEAPIKGTTVDLTGKKFDKRG